MATIVNKDGKISVINLNSALTRYERNIVRYAVSNYGFVNRLGQAVTFKQWIENIKRVYAINPRLSEIITVLEKC